LASSCFCKSRALSGGFFAVLALLVALPSRAETWIPTSRSPYGTAYAFDADSLKREGQNVTAWVRGTYTTGGFEKSLSRYNCSRKAVTALSSTIHRADGSVENRFTWTGKQQTEIPVLPGTYAEKTMKAICARR